MAPKIERKKLKDFPVYGGTASASVTWDGKHPETGDRNQHFKVKINPLSFDLAPVFKDPLTKQVKFARDVGSTENILYLPYHENCITSLVIPTNLDKSVSYFITDALSGCNFFIDELPNGDLVCYHANAKQFSPQEKVVRANPAATSDLAEGTMDGLHTNAVRSQFPEATPLRRLQASEYYAKPQAEVELQRKHRTGVEFFGGTTLMGFRVPDGTWEFWFQTYGRITCDKVGISAAPYQIFEARQFWA